MNDVTFVDPQLAALLDRQAVRAATTLNCIASENEAPLAILELAGSFLANKYAEGYPGRRYYAGCAVIDAIEQLAIDRCKTLFEAECVNVQPHAGSQANMAVYAALLQPGDTFLGMDLAAGGHLTHGHPKNFSGIVYRALSYGVDRESELLDYNALAALAEKERPRLIVAGSSSYSREIDFARIAEIARSVDAYYLVDMAHVAGLVAAKVHPSPVPYADCVTSTTQKTLRGPRGAFILSKKELSQSIDRAVMPGVQGGPFMHHIAAKALCFHLAAEESFRIYQQHVLENAALLASAFQTLGYRVVSGGTDTHLFVLDLTGTGFTGVEAEKLLEDAGILVSRSVIPFDTQKPMVGSGIRFGTPALTSRGLRAQEWQKIAQWVHDLLQSKGRMAQAVRGEVQGMCRQFPWPYESIQTTKGIL